MKKIYNINNEPFGIDFSKVICFYIDGHYETYYGYNKRYLIILIGSHYSVPNQLKLDYERLDLVTDANGSRYVAQKINDADKLYQDLIGYFKNNE